MMSDFESDKEALLSDLADSRSHLNEVVSHIEAGNLSRARRGSWPVSRILEHVLHSERLYAQLISVFSGVGSGEQPNEPPRTPADARAALDATRRGVLDAMEHVREQDFYRMQTIGHEEYSVLSILENVASHDREHAEQIRKTLNSA